MLISNQTDTDKPTLQAKDELFKREFKSSEISFIFFVSGEYQTNTHETR